MALYPSDDLALDVSSDRMTFAVLAGGDRVLHELPDVAMALLLPQNGECVESCSKHASRIHTQRPPRITNGWGREVPAYAVFPAKSRHTCTGITCLHRPRSSLGGENFQPRWSRVCNAPSHAARAADSGEEIVPAAEKLSACKRAEMLFFAFSSRLGQTPSRRIPPMPRWGQQFLLLEIYSMQRTHLLGEEMSKYRERTLRRFATAIEVGYGGEWTRRARDGVWTEWDETRGALVEWSEAVTQHGEETRRLMIYTLHEERSERCIQAVKR